MLKMLMNRYATPFTVGLFLVSLVSGIGLFFHVGPNAFHGMHEWLSMVLIVPFVLHMVKNWAPFTFYFKRGLMLVPLAISLVAAAVFFVPTGGGAGGNPVMRLAQAGIDARLIDLAPVLKRSPEDLSALLAARGFKVESTNQSLAEVAKASGKDSREALFGLLQAK